MTNLKFLVIPFILLSLLLPGIAPAQVIYEASDTSVFVFRYVPFENSINNKVLNQLALAHLKVPEKTSFNYTLRHRITLSYRQTDSLYMLLDVKPLKISGDIELRDFNLEPLLPPSAYHVQILITNAGGDEVINERKTVIMDEGMTAVTAFADTLWKEGTLVELRITGLSFTDGDYEKLQRELSAIRDYYASASMADTLMRRIRSARKRPATLNNAVRTLNTGNKALYLIRNVMQTPTQMIPGSDPLNVAGKIPLLEYNLKEYADYIKSSREESNSSLLIGNAYKQYAAANIQSLQDALMLSRTVDYYSSPFFYRLFSNSISTRQLADLQNNMEAELKQRNIKNFSNTRLIHEVLQSYERESIQLMALNRYAEAVDLLTNALKIKSITPFDHTGTSVETALANARKGLIVSYTSIMQKALEKNLVTLAETYITEVENYISKYRMTNTETGPFRDIYLQLAGFYTQLGYNSLARSNNSNALNEFTRAVEYLNGLQLTVPPKIENGLHMAVRSVYNDLIDKVRQSIILYDYSNASVQLALAVEFASKYNFFYPDKDVQSELEYVIEKQRYEHLLVKTKLFAEPAPAVAAEFLTEAASLQRKYQFIETGDLDMLIDSIGIKYIQHLQNRAKKIYLAKYPDSALKIAGEAHALAIRLNRDNIASIKQQHQQITQWIAETLCNDVKGQFHSLLQTAETLFRENKIALANKKAAEAKELAFRNPACGLTTAEVNKMLSNFSNQIRWNELVSQAFTLLKEDNFNEAARLIKHAESIYTFYRLDTVGLANTGLYDLAKESKNQPLMAYTVSHLINKGELDQAATILERLHQSGYPEDEAETLQETLARKLALRDITQTPSLNVKVVLKSYTHGSDWYTRFESVYRYYVKFKV